jgi:hypothetical protein
VLLTPLANAVEDPEQWLVGTWIVGASAALALATAFLGRTRLPAPLVIMLLSAAGAGLGLGGMMIRGAPSLGEVLAAVILLAVLVPAHVRIVLGRFGPVAASERTPATTPEPSPDDPASP